MKQLIGRLEEAYRWDKNKFYGGVDNEFLKFWKVLGEDLEKSIDGLEVKWSHHNDVDGVEPPQGHGSVFIEYETEVGGRWWELAFAIDYETKSKGVKFACSITCDVIGSRRPLLPGGFKRLEGYKSLRKSKSWTSKQPFNKTPYPAIAQWVHSTIESMIEDRTDEFDRDLGD